MHLNLATVVIEEHELPVERMECLPIYKIQKDWI